MYRRGLKRVIDVLISLSIIFLIIPVLLLAAILIKMDSRGKIFFVQERLGYKGRVFRVYKLRTMVDKPRIVGREILKGDSEVTFIGHILRRLKVDELPQIWNVLTGDMSIVGPRPGLPGQLREFNRDGMARLAVRPGLTGLAQVNGNIYLSWPERWKYDREYVEKLSFSLDMKIILKTFLILLNGEEKFIRRPGT